MTELTDSFGNKSWRAKYGEVIKERTNCLWQNRLSG